MHILQHRPCLVKPATGLKLVKSEAKGLAALAEFAGDAFAGGVLFYGGQVGARRSHALPLGMLLRPA